MGWVESERMSTPELIEAIKRLRAQLGDTQESLADKLGLSKRAIANYEKDRRPTATVMARLACTAHKAGLEEEASYFMKELAADLGLKTLQGEWANGLDAKRPRHP